MKTLLLTVLATISLNAFAADLATNVVAEHATMVGFAPPAMRGTHRFQLLTNGNLQKVDNKGKVTVVAKVSADVLAKVISAVDAIGEIKLTEPQGPFCMDAPSSATTVRQSSGKNVVIFRHGGCQDSTSDSSIANSVAQTLENLESAFHSVDYLKQ